MRSFYIIIAIVFGCSLLISCNNKLEIHNIIEENKSDTVYITDNSSFAEEDNTTDKKKNYVASVSNDAQKVCDINSIKWVLNKDGNFSYPCCFSADEEFIEDIPASVETYSYDDIELCYWPLLGFWATLTDYYPITGSFVGKNSTIKNITYTSRTGVYSGYTNDNRIYYMKMLISGGEVNHAHTLALIYPKSKQNTVKRIIKEVQHWKLPYAE